MDRIDALLRAMTLEEKCFFVAGKNMWETVNIDRLGIRSLKCTDGPAGVRGATWIDGTHTTYVPCGIALAATFDRTLVQRVGEILGRETRSKNAHVLLAPTMNISRSPLGGRNFENFGEDPLLTGVMASHYIRGVQAQPGVAACMKHYVANDMETRRFNMDEAIDERTLREIYLRPFQTTHEAATPLTAMTAYPKINGAHADCSVPLLKEVLRGEWGFEGLVMSDWGGLNDTVESLVAGTDLEMPGPPIRYGKALLAAIESGKVSERDHLDLSVRRILVTLDRLGLLDPEPVADATSKEEQNSDLPEFRQTAREAAAGGIVLLKNRSNGNNSVLPLKLAEIKKLVIIGPNAKTPTTGGTGSAAVNPYYITNPLASLTEAATKANPAIQVVYEQGIRTNLQPSLPGPMLRVSAVVDAPTGVRVDFFAGHAFDGPVVSSSYWANSVMFMMSDGDTPDELRGKPHCYRATGILTPTATGVYDISLSNTGQTKLYLDDRLIIDNTNWTTPGGTFMNCGSVNKMAELTLTAGQPYALRIDNVVTTPPLKPHDNTLFHTLSGVRVGVQLRIDEDALFEKAVAAAKDADAVVVVVGHNNDTEKEGIDRTSLRLPRRTDELVAAICRIGPSNTAVVTQSASAIAMPWADEAPAIVHAWFQGQENGNALADVLLGAVAPSGKLPVTFPRALEDHGSHNWFPGDTVNDQATYGERVLVGYRWFDAKGTVPLWPFGYGLSYTTFSIADVAVGTLSLASSDGKGKATTTLSFTVTNTGSCAGAEVVQVYVSPSAVIAEQGKDAAPRSLAGFTKVLLEAGVSRAASIEITSDAIAWYDVDQETKGQGCKGAWRMDPGTYTLSVGTSSRDFSAEVELIVQ
ncbi:hypothetical protein SCUCBS95973_000264 [Sporothrix curviconia]|uniref:beta-glucosidase n=1 Tax=Sporothrix curviconia TaxID=1260050 RepID=A0ABP0ANS1_9PEZI